ncbi:spore germination protein [Paenibacillus glycanilyticus]|uniref:Spore germination protein KA n=1 Tax=Paenibacillus glycanilyticus TaxID=126569 RepID=A0ABQ6GDH5_9BACL|nr:spore germination protein [Paenibacillus glycanilyticus]GLX68682.1 spore germination protein KA [Paenibacillus glycanilyticus]
MHRKLFSNRSSSNDNNMLPEYAGIPIDAAVEVNMLRLKRDLGGSDDLIMREIRYEGMRAASAAVVYIDGLSNATMINQYIFDVLDYSLSNHHADNPSSVDAAVLAKKLLNGMGAISTVNEMASLYTELLSGQAIILLAGHQHAYCADIREWKGRDVTESTNQTSIRGPRESFTETLRTNTSLIRRKIKDPRLWTETVTIGKVTKTCVTLMYLNGVVKPSVLQMVRSRLSTIDIDSILDSGYIEEQIEDGKWSLFPTVYNTELPDNAAGQLLEGKVAILVEGTPNVLIVPTQLVTFFQSTEDYYQRSFYASLLRILRFGTVFISLLFPSLYIAITTFHRDMLPASLLISLAAQREGVPFPAFFEALIMEITFEILREAGLRMPRAIGQAVSVVGTLVIGQAAVEAGIVSAAMVIVVSITAISTFTLPAYSMSIPVRILRFAFMVAAGSFGLFGIIMGFFILMLHLCALRSFGEPYMSPLSPFKKQDMEDALFRLPRWLSYKRPDTSMGAGESRIRKR